MFEGSKLVVKVVSARNLMPKDGQNSSSAFVQVVFNGQRKATRSIIRDLNPVWDETIEFPIIDFDDMTNDMLEVDVFDDSRRSSGKKARFLGRVGLHGSTFPKKGEEQLIYYKLEKTGLFSVFRRELGLIIYYTDENQEKCALGNVGGSSPAPTASVQMHRKTSSGRKAAPHSDRQKNPQDFGLRARETPADPKREALDEDNAAYMAHRVAANTERGTVNEERIAHKSTGLKRKMDLLREARAENERHAGENGAKTAMKASNRHQTRLSQAHGGNQPVERHQNGAHSSGPPPSRPPPSRPPPPVEFDLDSADSTAAMEVQPSSHEPPPTAKFKDHQHIDSQESSVSCEDPPLGSPSELVQEQKETKEVLLSAQLQENGTLPCAPKLQELSTDNLPERGPAYTSIDEIDDPLNLETSHEKSSISQSALHLDILPPAADATDMQPTIEVMESAPSEDKMHFDMKPTTKMMTEFLLNMDMTEKVEEVQPSSSRHSYAYEISEAALDDKIACGADLVEKIHYLFVRVVKARSFVAEDVKSNPNPCAHLLVGNQHAKTAVDPNTAYPEWNQIFAFRSQIDAGTLEVSIWDHTSTPLQDNFLGVVFFDLDDISGCVTPDRPPPPQWYCLESRHGNIGTVSGEVMLSVWIGTQRDEVFPDALQPETEYNASTRSKIYLSPKLWYLRLNVIEAQDLQAPDTPQRLPDVSVKVHLGSQNARTRVAKRRSISPFWNEDLLLIASEPFEDSVLITVEDHHGADKYEVIGKVQIPLELVEKRIDDRKVTASWFNLDSTLDSTRLIPNVQGRIKLRISLEGGYHVMDEAANLSSDLRPSAKQLWNAPIGVLELGIIGAQNLLPIKTKDGGHGTTDAYCVAKYGPKWVRTRTVLDNLSPRWNEQYTWEVYDPCTVLTLCVFDNADLDHTQQQQRNTVSHGFFLCL